MQYQANLIGWEGRVTWYQTELHTFHNFVASQLLGGDKASDKNNKKRALPLVFGPDQYVT